MTGANGALLAAYVDAYNRADWQLLGEYVSPGYLHHSGDQIRDLEGFVAGSIWFRNAFPDLRVVVHNVISEGDRIAMRFAIEGTHCTSVFGEKPTGKGVTLDGTTIYRFEDGVIAEDWEMMDEGQMRRQLGATAGL